MAAERQCKECALPALRGRQRCYWHNLLHSDLATQERAAEERRAAHAGEPVSRMPKDRWPPGWRWCAGCQCWVPLFYVTGSRCNACHRAGARDSHVQRTYGISGEEIRALKRWQGDRCFVCGRRALTRELAVDHDHKTGQVRGLLCSDDDHGCNVQLRRILADPAAAERLLAYARQTPLERMRAGQEPPRYVEPPKARDDGPPPF